jgi:Dynein light intermediate chain (DLIC)
VRFFGNDFILIFHCILLHCISRSAYTAGNDCGLKWSEMGVDIIIVACKSDLVKVDDAVSLKRAKAIQGQLRAIGLLIGAAVVYVSAMTDVNTARLRKYIIHKMYPEAVNEEGGIEVRTLSEERRMQSAQTLESN